FDGLAHGLTAEVIGAGNADLGPATISYDSNSTPVHAGTYTATARFAGNQDYLPGSFTATITIALATPTIVLNPVTTTYDALPPGVAAEAFGVNGADLGPVAITYSSGSAAPSAAGTYTATATVAGQGDYAGATAATTITINKAAPTILLDSRDWADDGQ